MILFVRSRTKYHYSALNLLSHLSSPEKYVLITFNSVSHWFVLKFSSVVNPGIWLHLSQGHSSNTEPCLHPTACDITILNRIWTFWDCCYNHLPNGITNKWSCCLSYLCIEFPLGEVSKSLNCNMHVNWLEILLEYRFFYSVA